MALQCCVFGVISGTPTSKRPYAGELQWHDDLAPPMVRPPRQLRCSGVGNPRGSTLAFLSWVLSSSSRRQGQRLSWVFASAKRSRSSRRQQRRREKKVWKVTQKSAPLVHLCEYGCRCHWVIRDVFGVTQTKSWLANWWTWQNHVTRARWQPRRFSSG